jgi:hypothetical protein
MNRDFHEEVNATLRRAMADLVNGDRGTWGVLGCYIEGARIGWKSLDGLGKAMIGRLQGRFDPDGIQLGAIYEAAAGLAAELPDDACGIDLEDLRGMAILGSIEHPERGAVCLVDAFFDDGWRHLTTWGLDEAAPVWNLISPADQASAEVAPRPAWDLLVALQAGREELAAAVSVEQQALNVELRSILADRLADARHAVFVIFAATDGWVIAPPSDLTERVRARTVAGADMFTALTGLAEELEADPPDPIGLACGFGTVVHVETDDGDLLASLAAVYEGTFHSVMWVHAEAAPDWEIIPPGAADPGLTEVIAVYQRICDAFQGGRS